MRILYHHRTSGEEPESVHIAGIVGALRRAGHSVDIIGPAPVEGARTALRPSPLAALKSRLPRALVESMQLLYNLRSFWQLRRALRVRSYDFIYERYALYNFAGVLAARWSRVPLLLEVNTLYAQAWAKYYGLAYPRLARALERATVRRADRIITVTEVQKRMLRQEGVDPAHVTVSHNAVDPGEFTPERVDADALRSALGLKGLVVGFVGTMNRWQGVQGFVEVVAAVTAARQDVSFLFVGEGERRGHLEKELGHRGLLQHMAFAGRQPHAQIAQYVAAMDICVLLDSNAYGSPMKVFEYWAMAKPVIAPRVPPVEEILEDERTGLLIEPGDAQAMSRQILRLAADPLLRSRLGAAGRDRVLTFHTWDRNADALLQAHRDCDIRARVTAT